MMMKIFFFHFGEFIFCPMNNNSQSSAFKSIIQLLNTNFFLNQADTANSLWFSPTKRWLLCREPVWETGLYILCPKASISSKM